LKRKNIFKK